LKGEGRERVEDKLQIFRKHFTVAIEWLKSQKGE